MGTISGCSHLKLNLKAKIYIYANSTTQRCPNKIIKNFQFEDFCHLHCYKTFRRIPPPSPDDTRLILLYRGKWLLHIVRKFAPSVDQALYHQYFGSTEPALIDRSMTIHRAGVSGKRNIFSLRWRPNKKNNFYSLRQKRVRFRLIGCGLAQCLVRWITRGFDSWMAALPRPRRRNFLTQMQEVNYPAQETTVPSRSFSSPVWIMFLVRKM